MGEPMYEQDRAWSHLCWLEFCRCTSNYFDVASPMYIWYHMHVPVLHSTLHMWYMCVHMYTTTYYIYISMVCIHQTRKSSYFTGWLGWLDVIAAYPCSRAHHYGVEKVVIKVWITWNGWFLLPLEQLSTLSSEKLLATFNLVVGSWK